MTVQTTLRNRCVICDRAIDNPNDRRETPCGRSRHQQCSILLADGRQVSCDCAVCETAYSLAEMDAQAATDEAVR